MKWALSSVALICCGFALSAPVPKLQEPPLAGKYWAYYSFVSETSHYTCYGEVEVDHNGRWAAKYGEQYRYGFICKAGGKIRLFESAYFSSEERALAFACEVPDDVYDHEHQYRWCGRDLLLTKDTTFFLLIRK